MPLIDDLDLYPGRHTGPEIDDLLDKVQRGDIIGGSNVNVDDNGNVKLVDDNGDIYILQAQKASTPSKPVFDKPAGNYNKMVAINITSNTTIYYTMDGSTPDLSSPHSESPVNIVLNQNNSKTYDTITIKARAYNKYIEEWSEEQSVTMNIYRKLDNPTIYVEGYNQDSSRHITITHTDPDAIIYRSLDGGNSWIAGGSFNVNVNVPAGNLKYYVSKLNWVDSDIMTYNGSVKVNEHAMYYGIVTFAPASFNEIANGIKVNANSLPQTIHVSSNNTDLLYFAYSADLEDVVAIKDQNGFNYIGDFDKVIVDRYKMYIAKHAANHYNMIYTFEK